MKYQVGDVFVSNVYGVVTILEVGADKDCYKCMVYDKKNFKDKIDYFNEHIFKMWVEHQIYRFYPINQ